MCYIVLLSTTSTQDLTAFNTPLLTFEHNASELEGVQDLAYPQRWYVASRTGCSCGFRHLYSVELGFGEPVDWYPEEEDDIKATKEFIALVRGIIATGHRLDCVDDWEGENNMPHLEMVVNLKTISDEAFRFFENYRFDFV